MASIMSIEFENTLLGNLIGEGSSRKVYECQINPEWVVKVEGGGQSFANQYEWVTWQRATKDLKKWLAPCVHISPAGSILIMKRCEPVQKHQLPKRIPAFFNDIKATNWGWLDKHPVCFDYGLQRKPGFQQMNMEKAEWV